MDAFPYFEKTVSGEILSASNHLTRLIVFLKEFSEKVNFEKDDNKSTKNYPAFNMFKS